MKPLHVVVFAMPDKASSELKTDGTELCVYQVISNFKAFRVSCQSLSRWCQPEQRGTVLCRELLSHVPCSFE